MFDGQGAPRHSAETHYGEIHEDRGEATRDLSDSKSKTSEKGSLYVMILVGDNTRTKWVRLMISKDQAGDVIRDFVADVVKPEELTIGGCARMGANISKETS